MTDGIKFVEGKMGRQILLFSYPIFLTSFFQMVFTSTDLFFVGNYVGKTQAAAVGSVGILITCMMGLFTGISIGTGIVTARLIGEQDYEKARTALATSSMIGMAGGILFASLGFLFMKQLLSLFKTPEDILGQAVFYARIYLMGTVPMFLFHVYSSFYKAIGEVKLPFLCIILGGISNIFLNFLFIIIMKKGIFGAGLAGAISQWVIFLGIYFSYKRQEYKIAGSESDSKPGFDRKLMMTIIEIGVPAGLQAVFLTISNILLQVKINQMGTDSVAAFSAYLKIETFIYIFIMGLGQTTMYFTSQNIGAGYIKRTMKGTIYILSISIGITILLSTILLVSGHYLFALFIKEPAVIEKGKSLIQVTFPFYFLYSVLEITGNAIRGLGDSKAPMRNSVVSLCIVRSVLLFTAYRNVEHLHQIAVLYPITWFLCAVLNSMGLIIKVKRIGIKGDKK